MKRTSLILIIAGAFILAAALQSFAAETGHGHAQQKMDHGSSQMSGAMHKSHAGIKIHESQVQGHQMVYHLIDMREKMKAMKNMPDMTQTHHLMVYIKDKDGNVLEGAKVGYLIEGPEKQIQKAMCMGMGKGFGADVELNRKGNYTIKTKAVNKNVKLMDAFSFEVK